MAEMSLSEIVKLAAETAAAAAMEQVARQERQKQKKKRDWRLRNTKLLLRHYREFVEHSENLKLTLQEETDALEDLYTDELTVEAIKRSKQRTLAMVRFMQSMIEAYRIRCEKGTEEEFRRYKVVHAMYIADEKLTADQIAKCHFVDRRTVFRDINAACETLSVLIFGVDAIHLE
ncbi:hypothetical protein LLE49_19430 [Alicyclobacillus tolerans]|uniref:hypothetical protein n=1 Tax=Alicyclobacillus tolerans TaxID=90970 RepID=UPI001F3113A0|nr:hypothetical protein [Alicyclobacillus tolerans]MCF8566894.1 hypothetical protein [Alicyclobacillus tolerans]